MSKTHLFTLLFLQPKSFIRIYFQWIAANSGGHQRIVRWFLHYVIATVEPNCCHGKHKSEMGSKDIGHE